MKELQRKDLIHPELSYTIISCAFDVNNEIGGGHHEKHYQRALAKSFEYKQLAFKEQIYYTLKYKGSIIGKSYLDFLVENKIIVEIKKGNQYSKRHIDQVLDYLKTANLPLAILINFGQNGVHFRRIVNFDCS